MLRCSLAFLSGICQRFSFILFFLGCLSCLFVIAIKINASNAVVFVFATAGRVEFTHWQQYCHGLHIPPTWFSFFLNLNIYWYHLLLHVLCFVCVAFISSFICSFYSQFFIHFSFRVLLTCLGKNVFMRHYCSAHCIFLIYFT